MKRITVIAALAAVAFASAGNPGVSKTSAPDGFFRVVEKDGRWQVLAPGGKETVLLGVDHVTYHGHASQRTGRRHHLAANKRLFPDKADWEENALARLKAWGFNMLGAGCDPALKHRGLVHTVFLSLGDSLCWKNSVKPDLYICPNEHRPCSAFPNVFHPGFAAHADEVARKKCAPNRDDTSLLGYFIDNELAWWGRGRSDTGLFDAVSNLPPEHSARLAQAAFLKERGVTGTPSKEDKLAFLERAAERYFRISCEAIRRHDPNHLVLGARFAGLGGAHPAVWEIAGRYCDIVTFNCYPWADLDRNVVRMNASPSSETVIEAFTKQYGHVKKPMLVTEWSFPALDSGLPCTGGAGQRFATQAQRTRATELFAKTVLALPFIIGYDYFMWVDEPPEGISDAFPEDSNYGLINERGEAYPEITSMFTRLHADVVHWRKAAPPEPRIVPAEPPIDEAAFLDILAARGMRNGPCPAFLRKGDAYAITNSAGLVLEGRIGGGSMFTDVTLDESRLGSYNGMICVNNPGGGKSWHDTVKVTGVEWRESSDGGRVFITAEGWTSGGGRFTLVHAVTVFPRSPWFLCSLVEARNSGDKPLDVDSFLFREYAPFFAEKPAVPTRRIPSLWKAPKHDAWFRKYDGAYFGALTLAPAADLVMFHIMDNGRSQHPDAVFKPERKLTLAPGERYRPEGAMWMLALCGLDGTAGWRRAVTEFCVSSR
ncbi:MAG: hypothetical protein J6Z49_02180 [Kiritimatiellae bacterium]|nr:hypothetical protein [Kiritimatiellia bacterium]